ncbi:hypothetical protein [Mailhella massiliensis]|uniref:PAS domain-containing protein n=1 Tax=Mailhella massiliensis TaxID=1903261 RepID=A0A921AWM0_9BACT|nr:hypothetical protein [Mailhella massiliensis]HJD97692.1 hypothetical protein [Mailhella massiliensis]
MDFSLWASGFPGLLWEVEHRRSRIRLLNGWMLPALGENTSRLLKDAQFRRRVVMKSDHTLLGEFWEMVTSRQAAMVSFRLNDNPHQAYLLQGWPGPHDPEKYFGLLKESVLPATFVANGTAGTCQLALGQAQYPVLVLSLDQKEIVTCNDAAQGLFEGAARGGGDFMLEDIAPGEMGETLLKSCRHAVEEEIWAGTLMLRSGSGSILGSKVRISPCSTGTDIVRIALLNIPEKPASCSLPSLEPEGTPPSLKAGLERLLSRCPGVDGLMFSDIQSIRGRVEVYGVGRLFSSLSWGASHAYEGTIAQDIERFSLDSLTVEDTLDSIKSIDWAMFIPCGVRSYFAKPFYSAEGLHAVLIFAFAFPTPGGFGEAAFRPLYEPFARLVAHWRASGA